MPNVTIVIAKFKTLHSEHHSSVDVPKKMMFWMYLIAKLANIFAINEFYQ